MEWDDTYETKVVQFNLHEISRKVTGITHKSWAHLYIFKYIIYTWEKWRLTNQTGNSFNGARDIESLQSSICNATPHPGQSYFVAA